MITIDKTYLNGFVSVHDDRNEKTEYDVDVEADERVEVDATEPPEHGRFERHHGESRVHVVSVDESKQALRRAGERAKL